MKKIITVRKKKSHRAAWVAIFVPALVGGVFCTVVAGAKVLVLCGLFLLLCLPPTLYYCTWRLEFEPERIVKRSFFQKPKCYPYSQIREAEKMFYISEGSYCLLLSFTDGKTIRFRLDDEEATWAEYRVKQHCSITVK